MFEQAGISHVHIFPLAVRIPFTDKIFEKYWGITIDGITANQAYTLGELLHEIWQLTSQNSFLKEIHLHHLLYANIEHVSKILDVFTVPIKFYIHDYYTICLQINLLKNDVAHCGSGAVSYSKCKGCRYYAKSEIHYEIIKRFLDKYEKRIEFIAPSEVVKDIWSLAYPKHMNKVKVIPHQTLIGLYTGNSDTVPDEQPINIAFVGSQFINKGWNQWENATRKAYEFGCDQKYYHFGKTNDNIPYIQKVPVHFSSGNINAMVEALRINKIDVVVLWSICPETYSYTYYESTAANAFIITNKHSGNIAAMVNRRNNGIVLHNEEEFVALLCDDKKLRQLVNEFKSKKNYGPLNLIENTQLLKLLTNEKYGGFQIQVSKSGLLSVLKRKFVSLFFYMLKIIRRLK